MKSLLRTARPMSQGDQRKPGIRGFRLTMAVPLSAQPALIAASRSLVVLSLGGLALLTVAANADQRPATDVLDPTTVSTTEPATASPIAAATTPATDDVLIIQGAGGESSYDDAFSTARQRWVTWAQTRGSDLRVIIDAADGKSPRDQLIAAFQQQAATTDRPLWIILIGHGTFNQNVAKFNLKGPDVTADEMAAWVKAITRPMAVIQGSSASGPFLEKLSGDRRVVITATRSGTEQNVTRWSGFFAAAISDRRSDLDHDGAVSLLEAFLSASRATTQFYADAARLATEHALLDDNGDRQGTSADFFRGIHPQHAAQGGSSIDGFLAHQWILVSPDSVAPPSPAIAAQRAELERQIEALRQQKAATEESAYYQQLEPLLVELARLSE